METPRSQQKPASREGRVMELMQALREQHPSLALQRAAHDEIARLRAALAAQAVPAAPAADIDEAALARMTEQGAKAWAGVDPQSLRDGSYAPAEAKEEPKLATRVAEAIAALAQPKSPEDFSALLDEALRMADLLTSQLSTLEKLILRQRATPQPQAAQPVAWQVWWGLGEMRPNWPPFMREEDARVHASMIMSNTEVRPLYTAAPALTEAAEEVLREALDSVEVHPCDVNNDAVRARGLVGSMQRLYSALRSTQGGE